MANLILACGAVAQCDDEDFERLSKKGWYKSTHGYAITWYQDRPQRRYMHRVLMVDIPSGMVVDHINRDKLDNRKSNLRLLSNAQNIANAPHRSTNKLGLKGITKNKSGSGFDVWGHINRKTFRIGGFKDVEEAKAAYDSWCISVGRLPEHGTVCEEAADAA